MPESVRVLVIGAGQAGLAASYWLSQHGMEHLILDRGRGFGGSWKARWASLEMITPNWMNGLPGLPYPGEPDAFSPKAMTITYLHRYGEFTAAPVRWNTPVKALRCLDDGTFAAETAQGIIQAPRVVIATGPYQVPRIPVTEALSPSIFQLHSSHYRVPEELPPGEVLVVGSGNSGVAIAIELSKTHRVVLACGSNPRVPRRVTGNQLMETMGAIAAQQLKVPEEAADREADLMRWLNDVGFYEMAANTPLGARLSVATSDAYCGPPLEQVAASHGIRLIGRDISTVTPHSVVWATGYRHDFSWIHADVFDAAGVPRHVRGVTSVAGLYFLGLRFLHTASSSLFYGVGRDARYLVEHLS